MKAANQAAAAGTSQTLGNVAFEALRRDIVHGSLRAGQKLRFDFLRKRYGLNVGALREGLSRLAAQGLVVGQSQRGFLVAPVSEQDLADVTELRCVIDSMALRLAIERGDMEWEKRVIAALHELSRTPRGAARAAEPNEEWVAKHRAFHEALLSGCSSPMILQMHETLFDRSERYRRLSFKMHVFNRDWLKEHTAIAETALERAPEACRLLVQHITGLSTRLSTARRRTAASAA